MTFIDFLKENAFDQQYLDEALINFNNNNTSNFNQIVILAGGAGSGKGYVKSNLLNIQGFTFDVDRLKELALKSSLIKDRIKSEYDLDVSALDLRNPDHTSIIHTVIEDLGISDRKLEALVKSILVSNNDRRPNLIFDITMKSSSSLIKVSQLANKLGYPKENIHVVWVLNDLATAIKQNSLRSRVVDDNILIDTYNLVAYQMRNILKGVTDIRKYMDGTMFIVFNQKELNYVKIKQVNKPIMSVDELSDDVYNMLVSMVPDKDIWVR
jgi:hypothetical protein